MNSHKGCAGAMRWSPLALAVALGSRSFASATCGGRPRKPRIAWEDRTMNSHKQRAGAMRWSPLALAVALACAPGAVWAQDDATELERVEVTGSRIKRAESEGQAPVLTLEREDIQRHRPDVGRRHHPADHRIGLRAQYQVQLQRQLRLPARRRRRRRGLDHGRPAPPRLQARAGAGRRPALGQRVVGLGRLELHRPQHDSGRHRRAHRGAGGRRLGDLRFRRDRGRGQHHHAAQLRRPRVRRLLRRERGGRRRDHQLRRQRRRHPATASTSSSAPATTSSARSPRRTASSRASRSRAPA